MIFHFYFYGYILIANRNTIFTNIAFYIPKLPSLILSPSLLPNLTFQLHPFIYLFFHPTF